MDTTAMQAIDEKRRQMKIEIRALCAQAGVGRQTYYDALAGVCEPSRATIGKLQQALGRFKKAMAGDPGPLACYVAYRCALAMAAEVLGLDAHAVLASDPARKATADKDWLAESRARRLAFWIVNGQFGFKATAIGMAAGVSKQAVSVGVREVDDDDGSDMARARRKYDGMFAT